MEEQLLLSLDAGTQPALTPYIRCPHCGSVVDTNHGRWCDTLHIHLLLKHDDWSTDPLKLPVVRLAYAPGMLVLVPSENVIPASWYDYHAQLARIRRNSRRVREQVISL